MPDHGEFVQNSITNLLRKKAKFICPVEDCSAEVGDTEFQSKQHISNCHPELFENRDISEVVREWRREPAPPSKPYEPLSSDTEPTFTDLIFVVRGIFLMTRDGKTSNLQNSP